MYLKKKQETIITNKKINNQFVANSRYGNLILTCIHKYKHAYKYIIYKKSHNQFQQCYKYIISKQH